jgi:predicted esterase
VKNLGFIHRFIPANVDSTSPSAFLLLHGTGGDEADLLDLGRALDPNAALLSPRGKVLENGAPRFFRRLAEGVFDEADVIARARELASFVEQAATHYKIEKRRLVAVGYSNGANIAAAMLLLGAASFSRAILFRPMVPFSPTEHVDLREKRALLVAGKFDPIARLEVVERLRALLAKGGARIDVQVQESGHELTGADVESARHWLARGER